MKDYKAQLDLDFVPEKEKWIKPDPVWFFLETADGVKVKVQFSYLMKDMPHFEFYGEISETGYRSWFPGHGVIQDGDILLFAQEAVNKCRGEFLEKTKDILVLKKGDQYIHWYQGSLTDDYTQTLKQKLKQKRKAITYPGFEFVSYYDECVRHIRKKEAK